MREVVIVSGVRTAIGTFGGAFRNLRAPDLTYPVMREVIDRARIASNLIDDVIWGCCYQRTRDETNIARVSAIKAGIPFTVPAFTIQRTCTSAMQAIVSGAQAIKLDEADVILAGGVESMSTVPYTIDELRWGARMRSIEVRDAMWDGLNCLGAGMAMGLTAENLAEKYGITREEQDEFAYLSQQRAVKAIKEGKFVEEILPIAVPQAKGKVKIIDTDEHPRDDASLEGLSKLRPAFKEGGTVTAGNSSGINDGAAAVLITSLDKAKEFGMKPMARIVSYAVAGVDPDYMGIGPVPSTKKALERAGLTINDIELIELNEAFAAQYLACEKVLGLDRKITNVNGGGIALGHPVGCTGTRLVVTLLYEMRRRNIEMGLASLCSAGGMGMTLIVEMLNGIS